VEQAIALGCASLRSFSRTKFEHEESPRADSVKFGPTDCSVCCDPLRPNLAKLGAARLRRIGYGSSGFIGRSGSAAVGVGFVGSIGCALLSSFTTSSLVGCRSIRARSQSSCTQNALWTNASSAMRRGRQCFGTRRTSHGLPLRLLRSSVQTE
jgi:hypothetical protein